MTSSFHYANDIVKSSVSERGFSCYSKIKQTSSTSLCNLLSIYIDICLFPKQEKNIFTRNCLAVKITYIIKKMLQNKLN